MHNQEAAKIAAACDEIKNLLLAKNMRYGNAALAPLRIFSKTNREEQIKVRIDDKLSRINNAKDDEDEDVILDLIGYLILLKVAQHKEDPKDYEDFWDSNVDLAYENLGNLPESCFVVPADEIYGELLKMYGEGMDDSDYITLYGSGHNES